MCDMTAKIRESAALANEVIDKKISLTGDNRTLEQRRACQALPAAGACMVYDVDLDDSRINRKTELFCQQFGKRRRNSIEPLSLQRVDRNDERTLKRQPPDGI